MTEDAMVMTAEPQSVWDVAAELGEGPVWADGAVWFVDIKKRQVHRYTPASGERRSWAAPEQIGFLLPAEGGGFVAGLQSGLHRFDPEDGGFAAIVEVEPERPSNRLNDAATDPSGRLWFGSMDDGESGATGRFYLYHRGRLAEAGLPPVAITNGPAVSPDGRILYWVDTRGGAIHAADLDGAGGVVGSRPFARIPTSEGHPDGPTVDSEGCVWVGMFGGWEARRYSPEGELVGRVRFPVSNITKLAFGGEDLRTVYATTARLHLKPEALGRQPLAGNLFAFRSEVPGLPVTPAAIAP